MFLEDVKGLWASILGSCCGPGLNEQNLLPRSYLQGLDDCDLQFGVVDVPWAVPYASNKQGESLEAPH